MVWEILRNSRAIRQKDRVFASKMKYRFSYYGSNTLVSEAQRTYIRDLYRRCQFSSRRTT